MNLWLKRGGIAAVAALLATGLAMGVLAASDSGPFSEDLAAPSSQEVRDEDTGAAVAQEKEEAGQDSGAELAQEEEEGPWLGVLLRQFPGQEGVTIVWVLADSPAEASGLKRGDVVTSVEGQAVETVRDLVKALRDKKPGDEVTLSVIKGGEGEASDVVVTLGTRPEPLGPKPALAELRGRRFEDFLGGQFSYRDKEGQEHTVTIDAGTVKSLSDDELVITPNADGEKRFTITDETRIPRREALGPDDRVVVVSVDGETRLVLGEGLLPLRPHARALGPFRLHRHFEPWPLGLGIR